MYLPPDEVAVLAEGLELGGADVGAVLAHDDAQGRDHLMPSAERAGPAC